MISYIANTSRMHTRTRAYTHARIRVRAHTRAHARTHTVTRAHASTRAHTRAHARTRAHKRAHARANTHAHTQPSPPSPSAAQAIDFHRRPAVTASSAGIHRGAPFINGSSVIEINKTRKPLSSPIIWKFFAYKKMARPN